MDLDLLRERGVFNQYLLPQENLGKITDISTIKVADVHSMDVAEGPWIVEWCCIGDQNDRLHIDTLDNHIRRNFEVLLGEVDAAYVARWIILGIFATYVEALKFIRPFKQPPRQAVARG